MLLSLLLIINFGIFDHVVKLLIAALTCLTDHVFHLMLRLRCYGGLYKGMRYGDLRQFAIASVKKTLCKKDN